METKSSSMRVHQAAGGLAKSSGVGSMDTKISAIRHRIADIRHHIADNAAEGLAERDRLANLIPH